MNIPHIVQSLARDIYYALRTPTGWAAKGRRLARLSVLLAVIVPLSGINWFCLMLDNLLFRGYRKQEIMKPLFIVSNPRCGSTFLHHLLIESSSNFTSMKTWEIYFAPSIIQRRLVYAIAYIDQLCFASYGRRLLVYLDGRILGSIKHHPVSLFSPEEDEGLFLLTWSGMFTKILFPDTPNAPDYAHFDTALSDVHKKRLMTLYKKLLQRHLYVHQGKRYVAKGFSLSPKLATIHKAFPDTNMVYIQRGRSNMLASTTVWIHYIRSTFAITTTPANIRATFGRITSDWETHALRTLKRLPAAQQLTISFDTLTLSSGQTIQTILQHFNDTSGIASPELEENSITQAEPAIIATGL